MGELVRAGSGGGAGAQAARERVVVWVDSRGARIARRHHDGIVLERVASDVPPHSGAAGHVRHDPTMRHGGAGDAQSAAERRRNEHLDGFLADLEGRLPPDADLELLGPGTVHERLARRLRDADVRHRRDRLVTAVPAGRVTDRQLAARLRALGAPATGG